MKERLRLIDNENKSRLDILYKKRTNNSLNPILVLAIE